MTPNFESFLNWLDEDPRRYLNFITVKTNQTKPMSKYKHAMERIRDMEAGLEMEAWTDEQGGFWTTDSELTNWSLDAFNNPNKIRTKPTPSKVPFGPEDFKPGMAVKLGKDNPAWGMVLAVQGLGDTARVVMTTYYDGEHSLASSRIKDMSFKDDDAHSWFWSMDGKEWNRFEAVTPPPPKREPRRVWVVFDKFDLPGSVNSNQHIAVDKAHEDWAKGTPVEFVEVIK